MSFESFPFVIGWELTLACNIRCQHCGSAAGRVREHELSTGEALKICDQFPELLVREVDFTGGEPMMRKDWTEISRRIVDLGIATKVLTNGALLKPDIIHQMEAAGISGVGVSVDGLEETHDRIRSRPGLFREIMEGISLLQANGIPASVITTANSLNVRELPGLMDRLIGEGIARWQIQPVFAFGRMLESPALHLSREEYGMLGEFIREYTPVAQKHGLDITPADSFGYFTGYDLRDPPWGGCPGGWVSCGITSDGKVKTCLSLPDQYVQGDLRKRSLWEIWFDENAFAFTRGFTRENLGPNCMSCDRGEQCKGGCSAMSVGYTGSFHNDPYCFYAMQKNNSRSVKGKESL
jgi:radical SAM protein with 4Fe4S-binding SPASM domain